MQWLSLADALQVGLVRFKRDLKNQGMTETQVHESIPDVRKSPRKGVGSKLALAK